ncbi:MAG TPA: alanine--glyoxylate aminotransferase family protein [Pirellulales bacterium]|nr:alanine--glyoxylate aminotransferase family protein [Pirellulales bacterium]
MKKRLMTPGPTQVPEEARLALARDVIHHRSAEFKQIMAEVTEGLKYVLQTTGDVVVLTASGSGGMEAAVVSSVPRGGKAIVLEGGVFARRWTHICQAFGIEVVRHEVPWGQAVDPADVARLLSEHPDAVAVFATLLESSTGVEHDIEAIGRLVHATPALLVVDAISGAGSTPCYTDRWNVDLLVVGSQKALMLPPGLALVAVSEKAWRQIESIEPAAFYFNLKHYRKMLAGSETPWTPAISLVVALRETLRQIRQEGIENVWARSATLAQATHAGIAALGLELFAERPAAGLTAVCAPPGIETAKLLKGLEERFGIKLAGGQDKLKGEIFRIGHFGDIDEIDILGTLAALELVLAGLGHHVTLGSAVAAAGRILQAPRSQQHGTD